MQLVEALLTGALSLCLVKTSFQDSSKTPAIHLGGLCFQDESTGRCVDDNALCLDDGGGIFTCKCKTGFMKDDRSCIQIIPLGDLCFQDKSTGSCADQNSLCLDDGGGIFTCKCKTGFIKDDKSCVQIYTTVQFSNEVTTIPIKRLYLDDFCWPDNSTGVCVVPNTACVDGGEEIFICSCITGYINLNGTCAKKLYIDDFCWPDNSTGVCVVPNSSCVDGGEEIFICSCINGFIRLNGTCLKVTPEVTTELPTSTITAADIRILDIDQFPKDTKFAFYINGNYTSNVKQKGNMFTVSGLHPGQCYGVQVIASDDHMTSSQSKVVTGCTSPNPPTNLSTVTQSSNAIEINITKGTWKVEYYEIYVNTKLYGTVMAVAKGSVTQYFINSLEPGNMYFITAKAVLNDYRSTPSPQLTTKTYPSSPYSIQCIDHSQTTISINITKGPGYVESFNIYVNNKKIETDSNVTSCLITRLKAGIYYRIYVTAVALSLTSKKSPRLLVQTDKIPVSESGYSVGALVGACIGSSAFTAILVIAIWFVIRQRINAGKDSG